MGATAASVGGLDGLQSLGALPPTLSRNGKLVELLGVQSRQAGRPAGILRYSAVFIAWPS